MDSSILSLLNFIEDSKGKVNLRDYAEDICDFVDVGDVSIGYSPFDNLSHDNYLDRRLIVCDNRYVCLETGECGDILDFIMKTKNLSFKEAVEELSTITGEKLPDIEGEIEERVKANEHKERLYSLMRDSMLHYYNNLKDKRADIAVKYLEKRGFGNILTEDANGRVRIDNDIVGTFALGYSIDEYALVNAMIAKGYTIEEMDECGLVYVKNGKAYDVMAGRLIVTILNRQNKVIAFSGRIFEAKGHQKYRNTGNTTLFSKKNELYGANNLLALSHQGKLAEVFVVEGYMDVISLYKAGVKNVVASMGTALTSDHARILKKYANNVYLTYDGDNAGQDAIRRGVDVLYAEGVKANVITLKGGKDPDEIIKEQGVGAFYELKHEARDMLTYKIDDLANKYNLEEAEDRGEYAVKAIELICMYGNKVDADDYLEQISKLSAISIDVLRQELYDCKVEKVGFVNEQERKKLTPKEKGLAFILYEMLTNKNLRSISIHVDSRDNSLIYDYLRLMGSGASEEEFFEMFANNDVASSISLLKGLDKEEMTRASRESESKLMQDYLLMIMSKLSTAFNSEKTTEYYDTKSQDESRERQYILNQCVLAVTRLISKQKRLKR